MSASSVVKESLTTASDGKKYKFKYYNLDVFISVGYRVKSTIQPELILEDIALFGPINLDEKTVDEFGSYKKELP